MNDEPASGPAPEPAPARDYHALVHASFNRHMLGKAVLLSPASGDIWDWLPLLIADLEKKD